MCVDPTNCGGQCPECAADTEDEAHRCRECGQTIQHCMCDRCPVCIGWGCPGAYDDGAGCAWNTGE